MGVAVMLIDTLLMNLGFGILVPLLALHFTGSLGFTAAAIGLVLALRQFTQQGLDLVAGIVADHLGARNSIALGCFVRAIGFLGIGWSSTLGPLIFWAVVSGIGGAFFDAPGSAALADLVAPAQRQRAFSASAALGNVGATVGPLVGVALLSVSFAAVGGVAAACFGVLGIFTMLWLPAAVLRQKTSATAKTASPAAGPDFRHTLLLLVRDRPFMWLTVLLAGYWFIWAQINLTVPLAAARFGGVRLAALVLALNAGLSIVLQYPLNSLVSRWCSHRTVLALCTALSAAGMALVFVSPLVSLLVLGVIVFALGRMIVSPVINVITAELAPAGKLGAYFGFGALSIGVGAGGGQIIGGVLYDAAQRYHQPALLWGSMLLVGTLVSLGLSRLRLPDRTSQPGSEVLAPRTDS
jgi:DHA1 family multidrug resistance protein-like MFS transporter